MNFVMNDQGDFVVAIGAPGSVERARIEFPGLIQKLDSYYSEGLPLDKALNVIRDAGARGIEIQSVLTLSMYGMRND